MEQATVPTGPQPVKRSPGVDPDRIPWMRGTEEGLEINPLRFFRNDRGRSLLLRLQSGMVIPRHRHTGEVLQRDDTTSLREAYERFCATNDIEVVDLVR